MEAAVRGRGGVACGLLAVPRGTLPSTLDPERRVSTAGELPCHGMPWRGAAAYDARAPPPRCDSALDTGRASARAALGLGELRGRESRGASGFRSEARPRKDRSRGASRQRSRPRWPQGGGGSGLCASGARQPAAAVVGPLYRLLPGRIGADWNFNRSGKHYGMHQFQQEFDRSAEAEGVALTGQRGTPKLHADSAFTKAALLVRLTN